MPAFRGANSNVDTSGSSNFSLQYPVAGVAGDLAFAMARCRNTGASVIAAPTGWTLLYSGTDSDPSGAIYAVAYRVLDGTENTLDPQTFTIAVGGTWSGAMIVVRPTTAGNTLSIDGGTSTGTSNSGYTSVSGAQGPLLYGSGTSDLVLGLVSGSPSAKSSTAESFTAQSPFQIPRQASTAGGRNLSANSTATAVLYATGIDTTPGVNTSNITANQTSTIDLVQVLVKETSAGPSYSAAPAFAGTGTLAVPSMKANVNGVVGFSGAGALSTSATVTAQTAATFSGTGSLAAQPKPSISAAPAFSGAGTLAASGAPTQMSSGTATFSGSGTLAASARPSFASPAAFAGSGTLTTTGSARAAQGAAFSGVGSLTGQPKASISAAPTFSGSGTLAASANAIQQASGTAGFGSTGTLAASVQPGISATMSFSGTGTLDASGGTSSGGTVAFGGTGSLATSATSAVGAGGGFSGSGALTASAGLSVGSAPGFSGAGTLAAATTPTVQGIPAFSGLGSLSTSGGSAKSATVGFSGTGSLGASATARETASGVPSFAGLGSLATQGEAGLAAALHFSGAGTLLVAAPGVDAIVFLGFSGGGTLDAAGVAGYSGGAGFAGGGTLTVEHIIPKSLSVNATLRPTGHASVRSSSLTGKVSGGMTAGIKPPDLRASVFSREYGSVRLR